MTRRSKIWLAVAALFTAINLAGAVYAAFVAEPMHAAVHVVLLFVGGYWIRQLVPRAPKSEEPGAQQANQRLGLLQDSVDAIAIEVERIGEAQRFHTKLQTERAKTPPPDRS